MKIIGHRGALGLAPENTLPSFAKALQHQVDEIECDARVTKDGIVILEHDERMHDAAGNSYLVADHSYAQLLKYKPTLTTLDAAIVLVDRQARVQVEVKPGEPVEPVVLCLQAFLSKGWKHDDFLLSSYDFVILKRVRELDPALALGVIESWSGVRASWRARRLGTLRISMSHRVLWRGFIGPMSRRGYQLCAYTLNDAKRAKRLARFGLYAAITDFPDIYQTKK
jgi:glycerophosphoryl diester phosphodiesterase